MGPRGQLLFTIPDKSTEILDSEEVSKQVRPSTAPCHLVGAPANLQATPKPLIEMLFGWNATGVTKWQPAGSCPPINFI